MSKGRFLGPDKLQNHTDEGKGKEKNERVRRKKGGEDKKAMIALLVVIWLLWRKRSIGGNIFKYPARCMCACMYVNTSKALEIERQTTVIKRNFSFNLDFEV